MHNACIYDFVGSLSFIYKGWFCWQVGISLASRKYDLNDARPFQTSDILNLQPVVKHSIPVCSEARDLVETGKVQLAEVCLLSQFCQMHIFSVF